MTYWATRLAGGLGLLLLGAACRSSAGEAGVGIIRATPPPAPRTTVLPVVGHLDPCALVTEAEAAAVAGRRVSPPQRVVGTTPSGSTAPSCVYSYLDRPGAVIVGVVRDDASPQDFEADKHQLEAAGHAGRPVAGLGDAAFQAGDFIFVRKNRVALSLAVTGLPTDAAQVEATTTLAQLVLTRLP